MRELRGVFKWAAALVATALVVLGAARAEAQPVKAKPPAPAAKGAKAPAPAPAKVVEISVTEKGYEPSPLTLKKGEPVTLRLTRKTDRTCATEILIQGTDINVPLPLNKPVDVAFTPEKTGTYPLHCSHFMHSSMGMSGRIDVE